MGWGVGGSKLGLAEWGPGLSRTEAKQAWVVQLLVSWRKLFCEVHLSGQAGQRGRGWALERAVQAAGFVIFFGWFSEISLMDMIYMHQNALNCMHLVSSDEYIYMSFSQDRRLNQYLRSFFYPFPAVALPWGPASMIRTVVQCLF